MFQPGAFQSDAFQQQGFGGGEGVVIPQQTPAGSSRRRRERYIARYKGEDHEFISLEELEVFVEQARKEQSVQPKRQRAPVHITLTPGFAEQVEQVIEPPKRLYAMPPSAALAQVRRIEAAMLRARREDDEDEVLLWLM